MAHTEVWGRAVSAYKCSFYLIAFATVPAIANGEDADLVARIKALAPEVHVKTAQDADGVEHIVSLGIGFTNSTEERRHEVLQILPYLDKLNRLERLSFSQDLKDDELKGLPPLPSVTEFTTQSPTFTDKGLRYLAGMKHLKRLTLDRTGVRGPGLAYLKDFSELQWLDLSGTPLNNSGIPHILKNFPKLYRFEFSNTKVSAEGFMQLADLHWLQNVTIPNDIVGPDPKKANTRDERRRLENVRRHAWLELTMDFHHAHIISKQKAREAGIDVPSNHVSPYGSSANLLMFHQQNYDENGNRRKEK